MYVVINWGDLPLCNIVINREDPPPISYYVIYGQPLVTFSRSPYQFYGFSRVYHRFEIFSSGLPYTSLFSFQYTDKM